MKTSMVAEDLLEREALTGEDGKSGGSGSSGSGNWPDSMAEEGKKATTASGGEEGHNGLWDYYFDFFLWHLCVQYYYVSLLATFVWNVVAAFSNFSLR